MYYAKQQPLDYAPDTIEEFLGYNRNLRAQSNEFYDMQNMTDDFYPVLSTRAKRGIVQILQNPQGIICRDTLCYVDGNDFYIGGHPVEGLILSTLEADCPKQLVSMGSYVCIFPDKKYVNTEDLTDYGSLESSFTLADTVQATYSPCKMDGTDIEATIASTAPSNPANGDYWIDTSGDTHVLKVWSETTSMWNPVATSYIKISTAGIGTYFEAEDSVKISNSGTEALDGYYAIEKKDTDCLIVAGLIDTVTKVTGGLKVERRVPRMDFVVECNNRLWGCYYGPTEDGIVNEIYACKQGDFKNWRYYQGTAMDSYTLSLGSDGVFTGAVQYQNTAVFFKENWIHHIYGTEPSNFTLTSFPCNGVQRGSNNSVKVVDGDVIYKANNGIYAYNGQLPGLLSYALGHEKYHAAVAGALNGKYYVSMKDQNDSDHLFVYNARTSVWHHEDHTRVKFFEKVNDELYFVDADNRLLTELGTEGSAEPPLHWMVETTEYGYSYPNKKYVGSVTVRLTLEQEAYANLFIQYDCDGCWETLGTFNGGGMQCTKISIIPRRCDRFKIKLSGKGDCKIYAITKEINQGSDK